MYRDKIIELIKNSHIKETEDKQFGEPELQRLEPRINKALQIIDTLKEQDLTPEFHREGYRIYACYENHWLYILNSDPDNEIMLTPYIKDKNTGNVCRSLNTSVDVFVNMILWLKDKLPEKESERVRKDAELSKRKIRVIDKIREARYRKEDQSIDEKKWNNDYGQWKDRIELAANIIKILEERHVFVLLHVNKRYITVSRPEKIYEKIYLTVLDLDNKEPLTPYVKDTGSGLHYGTDSKEASSFANLFLWVCGDLEREKCGEVTKSIRLEELRRVPLTEGKAELPALVKMINKKIDALGKDGYYKLDDKGKRWTEINPSRIVTDLENEGRRFEDLLWLAIKRHKEELCKGTIKSFKLLDDNDRDHRKYNEQIENYCIFFDEENCRILSKDDDFEKGILEAVKDGLLCAGYEDGIKNDDIKIDNNGIIRYLVTLHIKDEHEEDCDINVTGYIGQIFIPDDNGIVKTKYKTQTDNYWFVPGYYAFIDPVTNKLEENIRLFGYLQTIKACIRMQIIRDLFLVYDNRNLKVKSGIVFGETTNLNYLYGSLYDERFEYNILGEKKDIRKYCKLPEGIRLAIVKTLARRVRYPEYLYERSGVNALLKDEDSICMIRNTKIFDPEATSSGKNQGLVRYLVEGAKVNPDGIIVPGKEDDRTPIFNKKSFLSEYSKYNPFDRNQMVFSNLMKAYSITAPAKTALTTCGGWNMEDGFVVSKEFAQRNQVIGIDGKMRDLKIGDKMLDRGGNKGVISIIVDRKSPDKSIAGLVRLFNENPDLEVVASPYSGLSRFNGATARELMKKTYPLYYNGKTHDDCIGTAKYIITRQFADKKTKIYDDKDYEEGESRKASPQLSWALCSKDAKALMSYLYAEGLEAEEALNDVKALLYCKHDYWTDWKSGFFDEKLKHSFDVYSNPDEGNRSDKMLKVLDFDNMLVNKEEAFALLPYRMRKGFRMNSGKMVESRLTRNYQKLSDMLDKDKKEWDHDAIVEQISKINRIINKEYFESKDNIFKKTLMTRAVRYSTTAIWTPDPRLSVESIAVSEEIREALKIEEGDYLLIWRDPVLRDAGVRYMKVERIDPELTGIAINPVLAKGFDGDFDGDTVAVVKIDSEEAENDAIKKFAVANDNNLFDSGRPGEQLLLNKKLDLISAGVDISNERTVSDIDKKLRKAFKNDYVLDNATICLRDEGTVKQSLKRISDSGAKGGDLNAYILYFDGKATDNNRLAVQKATAIKAAVGIAGMYSQQLMRALRDVCPKEVLELTYPNTQALLQAKHDPERAVTVYKILQNRLMNAWNYVDSDNKDKPSRKDRIIKIYKDLGQPFGEEIDEAHLNKVCDELGNNKLKDRKGAYLDEFAYNCKFDYYDVSCSAESILKRRMEADGKTGADSEYCKLFLYDEKDGK